MHVCDFRVLFCFYAVIVICFVFNWLILGDCKYCTSTKMASGNEKYELHGKLLQAYRKAYPEKTAGDTDKAVAEIWKGGEK